ncbi:MAG: aminodeoxychorismate/anthranilate synthase component II [Candidatus Omnitrophota bacterium]|nr:aminodeoxychorismate/anthranilate synthase component II [Candidatus Omnitrophota bacterium]MDZ4242948.1 aminodeoxychorismate/anthranilate synthase component II [Candidatus Omnitrophota bacterium]
MILMIDNYDSFTYNLVQYLGELKANLKVFRNDALTLRQIRKMKPSRIVISPGPGRPEDAGVSVDIIRELAGEIPTLGVCLGHQAIGYAYGGKIIQARRLMHGKTSPIRHDGREIFSGVDNPFDATRYHSLVIDPKTVPDCLEVTAWTKDKDREIMGVRHKKFPLWGVQFHPESVLTRAGMRILSNFLKLK